MKMHPTKATKKAQSSHKLLQNYNILKTSWAVQTKVFFENSTLHGVRYIAERDRPFIEKFLWFACVAIGAVATAVIIVSLWEKFQTNPTITGLDTDFHNWEVPFPAITVCPEIPSNISNIESYLTNNGSSSELMSKFLYDLTQLTLNTIPEFVEKYSNANQIPEISQIKDLVYGLMNRCEDIFDKCTWKSYDYNCCDGFFPVFTERGFCYTFNSKHYEKMLPSKDGQRKELPKFDMRFITETDIKWSLKFVVKNDEVIMPIYILNSDEMAGIDVKPQHIWDFQVNRISFSVKQTYTTEDTRQLSIKQRHCAFSDEIELQIDNIYTYTACTRQCRMDTAKKRCGCVPHFYPTGHNNFYRHCSIKELSCIGEHLEEITSIDKCNCFLGCSNTVYEVEKLNENLDYEENMFELEAEFVSWPMVRYKREVLFGWVDLLVSFGGIAGLFLGFSLLSGVEIIYYFTIRACCMVIREKTELEYIRQQNSFKKRPEYDLSLVPYFISKPLPGNGIDEISKNNFFKRNRKNQIIPVLPRGKFKPSDRIVAPFGIEFVN